VVHGIHILGAIVWFGGAAAMNLVVVPGIFAQPLTAQRSLGRSVTLGFERLAIPAAVATALSGLLLGTVFGPLRRATDFTTPFGITWLASTGIVVVILATGGLVSSPALRRLWGDDSLWVPTADGRPSPALQVATRAVQRGLRTELAGLAIVFVVMEILRTVR
jgi:putative copper export protein